MIDNEEVPAAGAVALQPDIPALEKPDHYVRDRIFMIVGAVLGSVTIAAAAYGLRLLAVGA